jgi:hypothetical protein
LRLEEKADDINASNLLPIAVSIPISAFLQLLIANEEDIIVSDIWEGL